MIPDPCSRSSVARFVDGVGGGVVATVASDGSPEAAFVGLAALDDGTLIFNTSASARKVGNVRVRPRVAIVVTDEQEVSVQLEGEARISEGDDREQHGRAYQRRFPGSRALDDGFLVIAVRLDWVRVYDASRRPADVREARW